MIAFVERGVPRKVGRGKHGHAGRTKARLSAESRISAKRSETKLVRVQHHGDERILLREAIQPPSDGSRRKPKLPIKPICTLGGLHAWRRATDYAEVVEKLLDLMPRRR